MRVNWAMTNNPEGLRSTSALCRQLKIDKPKEDLIKHNFTLMHKMIQNRLPEDIMKDLIIPKRRCGKIYVRGSKYTQKSRRSPIVAGIYLYNAIPADFKALPHKLMKKKLKKLTISYSLFK